MRSGSAKYKQDPDDCHEDMGWSHSQAQELGLICSDCGLDFHYDPPRTNFVRRGEESQTVVRHRFYGVDKDGWLVGDATDEFDIDKWIESRDIDTALPHARRPTPPQVEDKYRHDPFYIIQETLDQNYHLK